MKASSELHNLDHNLDLKLPIMERVMNSHEVCGLPVSIKIHRTIEACHIAVRLQKFLSNDRYVEPFRSLSRLCLLCREKRLDGKFSSRL